MDTELEKLIEQYIEKNLKLKLKETENFSECSYNSTQIIELSLNDKVISNIDISHLIEKE